MLGHVEKPRLVDHDRNKLQYQLAGVAALIGIVLVFIAVRFDEKDFLISKPGARRTTAPFTRMWFDNNGMLTGARLIPDADGAKLIMERWPSGRSIELNLTGLADPASAEPLWTASAEASRVAWVDGRTLRWIDAGAGGVRRSGFAPLPQKDVLSLGVLSGGSLVAAYSDGSADRWDSIGRAFPGWQGQLHEADQAAMSGDYLAFGSAKARRLTLYHFRDPQGWSLAEDAPVIDSPYRLVLPAGGIMAQISAGQLRVNGKTRNSPGPVRYTGSHQDDVLASGDFDGIFVLTAEDEAYALAPSAPGSLLAVGESQIAVSGPRETALFDLGIETRLNKTGRGLSYISLALFIIAAILVLNKFLREVMFELLNTLLKRKPRSVPAPPALPGPPGALVEACAREEAVLWAGAGLSAQSGLPVRSAFVRTMLQEASVEGWMGAAVNRKLTALAARDHESALDQLVASSQSGAMRNQLTTYFRSVVLRYARASRSHELLSNIPFAAAITTNYDRLLLQMGHRWEHDPLTLGALRPPELDGAPFLLQLYGDPDTPKTMLFSRAQLHEMLPKVPAVEIVRGAFARNNLMFVGCSLDGLIADLKAAGLPEKPLRQHFAIVGAGGSDWPKHVAELQNRYGIQVLACQEDKISSELPEFLQKLSREVDRARGFQRTDAPEVPVAVRAPAR